MRWATALLAITASIAAVGIGSGGTAQAQADPGIAGVVFWSTPTASPGSTVTLTGTFDAAQSSTGPVELTLNVFGSRSQDTFVAASGTGLDGPCVVESREVNCPWTPPQNGGTVTVVATVEVGTAAVIGSTWNGRGLVDGVRVGMNPPLDIVAAATTTTTTTTVAPDTSNAASTAAPTSSPPTTSDPSDSTPAITTTIATAAAERETASSNPPTAAAQSGDNDLPSAGRRTTALLAIATLLVGSGSVLIATTRRRHDGRGPIWRAHD